jgi:FkbM family methyltransferase
MDGTFAKRIVDRLTGYWIYKSRHLPIGTDLRLDVANKLGCKNLPTIFDVGANFGQTYVTFRRHFPKARIFCFEPVTDTFEVLRERLAGDPNARAERLAFGKARESRSIRLFDDAPALNSLREDLMSKSDNAREEIIQVDTIDNYCSQNGIKTIDLLKIDTEGFEIPVMEGARATLERGDVSMIFAEAGFDRRNGRNSPFNDIVEYLLALDYRFFGIYDVTHEPEFGVAYGNALFVKEKMLYPGLGS